MQMPARLRRKRWPDSLHARKMPIRICGLARRSLSVHVTWTVYRTWRVRSTVPYLAALWVAEFDTPREIKYIELQELANGLRALLAQNLMAEKNGLFKLLAGQLGFARLGEVAQERMEAALALLGNEVERNGEMLSLK